MRLNDDEVWASGIPNTAPAVARIAGGFQCGDADPQLFNWLFNRLAEAMITLQNEVTFNEDAFEDFIDAQDDINTELDSRTQQASRSTNGIARFSNPIDWPTNPPRDTVMVSPAGLQERDEQLGAYWQRFNNANSRWEVLLEGGTDSTWFHVFDNADQVKGVYLVALNLPEGIFNPNTTQMGCEFQVTFKRRNATPDNLYLENRLRVTGTDKYIRVGMAISNIEDMTEGDNFQPNMRITVYMDDDSIEPTAHVAQVQKLIMPLSNTSGFAR